MTTRYPDLRDLPSGTTRLVGNPAPEAEIFYAAIDGRGDVLGVEESVDEAVAAARAADPGAEIAVQTISEAMHLSDHLGQRSEAWGGEQANPAYYTSNPAGGSPSKMARMAMAACAIAPTNLRQVTAMPLEHAHALLERFFDGLVLRGKPTQQYKTPSGMAEAWLGQNYKTAKAHPEQPSKVMGLALVPHHLVVSMAKQPGIYGRTFTQRLRRQLPTLPSDFTLCKGSNNFCRDSCLVFAGQNASELYNSYRKAAQTLALLHEPVAFGRVLHAAIEKHLRISAREGYEPYLRLNVLSDIPWELVAPWLFDEFHGRLAFYDYTKVAGRVPPPNYDLTFSFSGTNEPLARAEIAAGRRVAVVFLARKQEGTEWRAWKLRGQRAIDEIPLPRHFWGLQVIDGDVSDVRPLDPAPSIVGLRWKTPSGTRAGVTVDPTAMSFVVPVYIVESSGRLERPNGRGGWGARPNPEREQWLVSAVTPRFQPIVHDVAQPI